MTTRDDFTIRRPAHEVFTTLCDPTTYPVWLVGAQTITHVDDEDRAPGGRARVGGPEPSIPRDAA
jgi:uncharacterized protein YndB with AHSA1/START domain